MMPCLLPLLLLSPMQGFGPVLETAWRFDGSAPLAHLGTSVALAGDVNGDGQADLLVGAPGAAPGGVAGAGSAFVYSGADGTLLYRFDGSDLGAEMGRSVAGVGDLDHDGYADFAIGAPGSKPDGIHLAGTVFVHSGWDGHLLWQLDGEHQGDMFGQCVQRLGDADQDGTEDVIVAAPNASPAPYHQAGTVIAVSGVDGSLIYRVDGNADYQYFGHCAAVAGDVDHDHFPDVLVGAPLADVRGMPAAGSAFVFSGRTGRSLARFDGRSPGDFFGQSVDGIADLDGDGAAELLIGANGFDLGGRDKVGAVYVYSGGSGTVLARFTGKKDGDELGYAVAGLGDSDGDGVADLLLGAWRASPGGVEDAGSAVVLSGATGRLLHRIDGENKNAYLGSALASLGDWNGDGLADFAIGAYGTDSGGWSGSGSAQVLLSLDDHDGDLLATLHETAIGTDPNDQDSDDDGLSDAQEWSANPEWIGTDPLDSDSDGDGLLDGTEMGLQSGQPGRPAWGILGTDPAVFQPDLDPATTTDPTQADSDGGGIGDGGEDANHNGRVDIFESDPLDPLDDRIPGVMTASPDTLSASAGGLFQLAIDFPATFGGQEYFVYGSLTGTTPGFELGGLVVPLVYDALTDLTFQQNYLPNMTAFHGNLDAAGDGLALFSAAPGEFLPLLGRTAWWAAVSWDGGLPENVTNAAGVTVTP